MSEMSIREFELNPSRAIAMVDAGLTVRLTRDGQVVADLVPPGRSPTPAEREAALRRLLDVIDGGGLPFGRRFSYDERTG